MGAGASAGADAATPSREVAEACVTAYFKARGELSDAQLRKLLGPLGAALEDDKLAVVKGELKSQLDALETRAALEKAGTGDGAGDAALVLEQVSLAGGEQPEWWWRGRAL
jgi:hypothetical protein